MTTRTLYDAVALSVLTAANFDRLPKGWIGYASVEANQTGIGTSATDLTGLTVTVDVPADRVIRVSGQIQANPSVAAYVTCRILQASTQIGRVGRQYSDGEEFTMCGAAPPLQLAAGTYTFKLQGLTSTGTFDMEASNTAPAWIGVEDLGATT